VLRWLAGHGDAGMAGLAVRPDGISGRCCSRPAGRYDPHRQEHLRYAGQPAEPVHVDQAGAVAAVDRIAAGLQADLRMVNAPIYRLTDYDVSAEGNDYAEDAQPYRSVEREMEEELFGREDVDSVFGDSRQADPMDRSRLSAPTTWTTTRGGWSAPDSGSTCSPATTSSRP
jgi:hypothetical protein